MILSTLLLTSALGSPAADSGPELWAGHQVTYGRRDVPFQGTVRTRTDTFVLAQVTRTGDRLELKQTACYVRFRPVAGVQVRMNAKALPQNTFSFRRNRSGEYGGTSTVAWSREDVDSDGKPGMSIEVDAPVCSGRLFVSNASKTNASAAFDSSGAGFHGKASVHVEQSVLGAEGACLSVVAKDTDERVNGPFSYVPVPPTATCESLLGGAWPVNATKKQ